MPEYLAPDVYVEEIDTGSKPIEGVSTSTAGMLGVAERGPVNVPILVTSYGEFERWFGGELDPLAFVSPGPPPVLHCFLPHAVQGFFTNGGKRLYVTRIEAPGARRALFELHDRGTAASAAAWLLRPAPELSGSTAAAAIYVTNVNSVAPGTGALADGDHIRVGGGSDAEYRDVGATPNGVLARNHVTLTFPLARAHTSVLPVNPLTNNVHEIPRVLGAAPNVFPLAAAAASGAATVDITAVAGNVVVNDLVEIQSGPDPVQRVAEYRFVRAVTVAAPVLRLTLDSPLQAAHGIVPAATVSKLDPAPAGVFPQTSFEAARDALPGDRVAFLAAPGPGNYANRANLVIFDRLNNATREARRIGQLSVLSSATGAYDNYPAGAVIEGFTVAPDPGVTAKALTADTFAGASVLPLGDRSNLVLGQVLQIGAAAPFEFATITQLPDPLPSLALPGQVVLSQPLSRAYAPGTAVVALLAPTLNSARPSTVLTLPVRRGATLWVVGDGGSAAAAPPDRHLNGEVIRVTAPGAGVFLHTLGAAAEFADARPVQVVIPVGQSHSAGSPVAERTALVQVQALDTGGWGNRLRVSVADEDPGLVSRTPIIAAISPNRMRLASPAGVERGTVLELVDATGAVLTTVKVLAVERATAEVTLDTGVGVLSGAQIAAINLVPSSFTARSREFRMVVRLLAQPDPTLPGRGEEVLDRTDFRNLSMDPRHSRYVQTVLGAIGGPPRLSDRRPDGESWYVRVLDLAPGNGIRPGPETLTDLLADGRIEPARHPLAGGNDSIATLTDAAFIGADNANPENRTGLFSLRNIEDISIVAVPGRTSTAIHNALINHCEIARYRFAVLDAHRPPRDSIADVINQRQQFDTKYAAIYHPWLLIPPPFPTSPGAPDEYPIPPSGHVVGVYARTDIERGVHKAPANEVVRGVVGLQRLLNKGEHDILNPYPVNINVIRDFRSNSRGIRVYGGRVITSDSDWKYVNVRRLLIFIEASLNRGLQWVVFEPNADPLWARVRRSIANFLTLVWRNGALEGTKVEEAFFVKCDRTTMTQTDIDSGRLICVVGVAPVKPAEFVIVRIGLWTAHADD
jgi:phage tail sheath protein FI